MVDGIANQIPRAGLQEIRFVNQGYPEPEKLQRGITNFLRERLSTVHNKLTNLNQRIDRQRAKASSNMNQAKASQDNLDTALEAAGLVKKLRARKPQATKETSQAFDSVIQSLGSDASEFYYSTADGMPILSIANPLLDRANVSMAIPDDAIKIPNEFIKEAINLKAMQTSIRRDFGTEILEGQEGSNAPGENFGDRVFDSVFAATKINK